MHPHQIVHPLHQFHLIVRQARRITLRAPRLMD
jgi:hypothetical protein